MSDDEFIPLFMHDEPGPQYSVADAVTRIAQPGESPEAVGVQIRSFLRRDLVHTRFRRGSGRTAASMLGAADVATAHVLRALTLLGVADTEVLRHASWACYSWDRPSDAPKGCAHPMTAALVGFLKGEYWTFRLDLLINHQTGARTFFAAVYDPERYQPAHAEGLSPIGSIVVPIYDSFPAILRNASGSN